MTMKTSATRKSVGRTIKSAPKQGTVRKTEIVEAIQAISDTRELVRAKELIEYMKDMEAASAFRKSNLTKSNLTRELEELTESIKAASTLRKTSTRKELEELMKNINALKVYKP